MKLKWLSFYSFIFLLFISAPPLCRSDQQEDRITVVFPGTALAKVISEMLPLRIDPGGRVSGNLSIASVRDLRFDKNKVLCSIRFVGKETKYTVPVQETTSLVIDIGDLDVAFDLEGALRFDPTASTLYVKPMIVGDVQGVKEGSPLKLLLSLLSDMEYAVPVEKLVPMGADPDGQAVQLHLSLVDVIADKNELVLTVYPQVVKTKS